MQNLSREPLSLETRYVRMIVESEQAPWKDNLLASAAQWILLAGYLVLPGTFTSLEKSNSVNQTLGDNEAGEAILSTIQHPPLLALAVFLFILGATMIGWLFWEYRGNYIWLVHRLFMYAEVHSGKQFMLTGGQINPS